jgi:ubiquinone/menaquinone biosynthesis C-methylase UbiE
MTLPRLEHAEELLDAPRHDTGELAESLGHVAAVNRWLGGVSAVVSHIKPLMEKHASLRLLDVATGSADIPCALMRYARRHGRSVAITATDVHPQMLEVARKLSRPFPEIVIEAADALRLPYEDNTFDVVMLSLALHHFDSAEQPIVLREMARVSKHIILVNDLARTRLNYFGSRLLGLTVWRRNRLTRHDGPLSVLRSFTAAELQDLAHRAGLRGKVHRHFFQRIVLVADARSAKSAAVDTELK